jgi:hypothetical protein
VGGHLWPGSAPRGNQAQISFPHLAEKALVTEPFRMNDFIGRLRSTVHSYLRSTHYLAREPGRTWPTTLLKLVWIRVRYRMNPSNLAFFSIDGRWPDKPGDYIHRWYEIAKLLKKMNPEKAYAEVNDKIIFYRRCVRHSLPTPTVFTAVVDEKTGGTGNFDSIPVSRTPVDFAATLGTLREQDFFCKPLDGINGKGGFAFKRTASAFSREGKPISLEDLFTQIQEGVSKYGTMIVQERLRLHPTMLSISPSGALSTVRIVSCLQEGEVRIVASILKICAGANETDNFVHGLTGNLLANIDGETGRLSKAVGSASSEFPYMRSVSNHPDNMQAFEGFQLPDWAELRKLVVAAHRQFDEFWTLGWDIGLTDRGPVLVEANPDWAVDILQVASRKGLRHEFDRWEVQLRKEPWRVPGARLDTMTGASAGSQLRPGP